MALRSGTRRCSTTVYTALSFRRVTKNTPAVVIAHVTTVHDHNGPGVQAQGAGHPHVMPLPLIDDDHTQQVAVVVQQAMQRDRVLGPPKVRPVEQRRAQVDHRGVQTQQLVLEPKLPRPRASGWQRAKRPSNTAR